MNVIAAALTLRSLNSVLNLNFPQFSHAESHPLGNGQNQSLILSFLGKVYIP
jgi:hypothetical protein